MNDLISRQAAIEAMRQYAHYDDHDVSVVDEDVAVIALKDLPSVQPEQIARDIATIIENEHDMRIMLKNAESSRKAANEWCTDCKEYDQDRHCCPRWNRVIRNTVEELKAERWIPVTDSLPDKKGHYLATNLGRVYITGFNGEVFGLRHVTAWMPLPEPYKGRTDE